MSRQYSQSGFTMLEVMVALVIFAVSLIGVMGISTMSVYYNAMSRQVDIASMFGIELADTLKHLTPDGGTTFLHPAFNDSDPGNNNVLGVIDLTNEPPSNPPAEHSESEIGLISPIHEGIVYQRFWNVADVDQNNDGIIEVKQIAVIVRWRKSQESHYHYSVISFGLYRPPGI